MSAPTGIGNSNVGLAKLSIELFILLLSVEPATFLSFSVFFSFVRFSSFFTSFLVVVFFSFIFEIFLTSILPTELNIETASTTVPLVCPNASANINVLCNNFFLVFNVLLLLRLYL